MVLDARDPDAAAAFWSAVLGEPITYRDDGWVVVSRDVRTSGLAFQRAPDHQPPAWRDPARPQQIHLDVMVEDRTDAAVRVCELGAVPLPGGDHVFADPAGHPFCLVPRPRWAAPVGGPP